MAAENFDWDKYFSNAKWDDIREKSPFFDGQRSPSLLLEDVGLVYLSSLDVGFSISDIVGLKSVTSDVKSVFKQSIESKNYYKAAVANTDLEIIDNLLNNFESGVR